MSVRLVKGNAHDLREGDIVFTRWNRKFPSSIIALYNQGISHVSIVLRFNGILYNCDATRSAPPIPDKDFLKNEYGTIVRRGVHGQRLCDSYTRARHMWVMRSTFTPVQLKNMRRKFMDLLNVGGDGRSTYETSFLSREFLHSLFGWRTHTPHRYMCSEAIATILQAGNAWDGRTNVMPGEIKDRINGTFWQLF